MNTSNKKSLQVIDVTPKSFQCAAIACPAIFETENGTFILVGKKLTNEDLNDDVKRKIGEGEIAIEIPMGLITELITKK